MSPLPDQDQSVLTDRTEMDFSCDLAAYTEFIHASRQIDAVMEDRTKNNKEKETFLKEMSLHASQPLIKGRIHYHLSLDMQKRRRRRLIILTILLLLLIMSFFIERFLNYRRNVVPHTENSSVSFLIPNQSATDPSPGFFLSTRSEYSSCTRCRWG